VRCVWMKGNRVPNGNTRKEKVPPCFILRVQLLRV